LQTVRLLLIENNQHKDYLFLFNRLFNGKIYFRLKILHL